MRKMLQERSFKKKNFTCFFYSTSTRDKKVYRLGLGFCISGAYLSAIQTIDWCSITFCFIFKGQIHPIDTIFKQMNGVFCFYKTAGMTTENAVAGIVRHWVNGKLFNIVYFYPFSLRQGVSLASAFSHRLRQKSICRGNSNQILDKWQTACLFICVRTHVKSYELTEDELTMGFSGFVQERLGDAFKTPSLFFDAFFLRRARFIWFSLKFTFHSKNTFEK